MKPPTYSYVLAEPAPSRAGRKSLALAYFLWLFLGLFGAHRFYLGRWFTGLLFLISFGFYGLGWLLDGLLMPWLVSRVNRSLAARPAAELEPVEVLPVADWAARRRGFRPLEAVLRLLFFATGPMVYSVTALLIDQWELLVIMAATLVVCALLRDVEGLLSHYPTIARVPMLGDALRYLQNLSAFYREHEPAHFLYYLLYPVLAPFALFFSPVARQEFGQFARLVGGVMLVVIARIGMSYSSIYPPYLGLYEAFIISFTLGVFIMFLTGFILIPTVTTALTLNATNQQGQFRVLAFIGLLMGVPVAIAGYLSLQSGVTLPQYELVTRRLARTSFRADLNSSAAMFLGYWARHYKDAPDRPAPDKYLTARWQHHLGGMIPREETRAFRVLSWKGDGRADNRTWLGIVLIGVSSTDRPGLLYLMGPGPQEACYQRWDKVPAEIQTLLRSTQWPGEGNRPGHFFPPSLLEDRPEATGP